MLILHYALLTLFVYHQYQLPIHKYNNISNFQLPHISIFKYIFVLVEDQYQIQQDLYGHLLAQSKYNHCYPI